MSAWGSLVERERRTRILLTIWACAYEFYDDPIVTDEKFDEIARRVDLKVNTGRPDLDEWWRRNFQPHTGQWIHRHPELQHVKLRTEMVLGMRPWSMLPLTPGREAELDRQFRPASTG